MLRYSSCLAVVLLAAGLLVVAAPPVYDPPINGASEEGEKALNRFRLAEGLAGALWAAEPNLANPVAFCFDAQGRCYVAETFRLHKGVTDIRQHMNWLDDDLACRTVADRIAMYKKHLGKNFGSYAREHDRVRLLTDTSGDGKADKATVFADGFKNAEVGLGSGLLAHKGKVYYTNIPDLWLLEDTKNSGQADVKKSLQTGYGVHVGFLGHDLHGLCLGPDRKLYFSIGDRGLHVKTPEGVVSSPDTGAVLRCNLDGSDLELFATGLRNPQELAFDQFGNLFTVDNNADAGDQARFVYLVQGGDSGWRIGYQHLKSPTRLGPWNAEKLWLPQTIAPYRLPPLANVSNGPSGFCYHPGLSRIPERYREHFFLADFRGGSGNSGIRAFAAKPDGASFQLVDSTQPIWSILATDVDFGPDGYLYVSDWVEGWGMPKKGRIYRFFAPDKKKDQAADAMQKLLVEDLTRRGDAELVKLLDHPDMRVRREAEFALVDKKADDALADAAKKGRTLARMSAIWGLGIRGRDKPEVLKAVVALLDDKDPEVRAQSAKVLGEDRFAPAGDKLIAALRDPEPRVRFFAAQALARHERKDVVEPVLQMLKDNGDRDAYLRHAGVASLAATKDARLLANAGGDPNASARLGVLLALRRLESPEVAQFLHDAEPALVLEAARAINDAPIPDALPKLAALIERPKLADPVLYRVLNAHFRLGKPENARAVARYAAREDAPEALRIEALKLLDEWAKPSGRDRIVGLWRPLGERDQNIAGDALRPALGGVFSGPDKVRQEAARLAGKLGIKEVGPVLFDLVVDKERPDSTRVEALRGLQALKDNRLKAAVAKSLKGKSPALRSAARDVLANLDPKTALSELSTALDKGTLRERQAALTTLGDIKNADADKILSGSMDELLAGKLPAEIRLDLLEAAARRKNVELNKKLAEFEGKRSKKDPLAAFRESLAGGDAEAGRRIFFLKSEVSCLRCHKIKGEGGEVGPELFGLAAKQPREYLLEAIVNPNGKIAEGFDTLVITLTNGKFLTGILKKDEGNQLRLVTPEGKVVVIPKDQIDETAKGKSAMPEDLLKHLSKREIRDLVEFLATQK